MGVPSNKVVGVAILIVAVGLGLVLMGREDAPEPEVRKAQSRATIERELRDGEVLEGPDQAAFAMRFTDDWTRIDGTTLGEQEAQPVAGLRRKDNSGLLTVSVRGPVRGGIKELRRTLAADLEQRFDDFRLVAIRPVQVKAGRALYASFVREKTGQIQTMLVVSDGNRRSFQVDAAIRGEARDTAAQVGAMLATFDLAR
jgi:hypothetical protein